MQYEKFVLAWWFNVGVQIFLCISGYLYGQKSVNDITVFFRKRFIKILIPYYFVFLTVEILELLFDRNSFSFLIFGAGLLCGATIPGGGHLWFVPVILFCYILSPILGAYRDEYICSAKSLWVVTILATLAVSIFCAIFCQFYNPAWLSCYVIGYSLGVNEQKNFLKVDYLLCLFAVMAMIGNGIQIYCDYFRQVQLTGNISVGYHLFQNYNHVWLGIFLFLLMKMVFDRVDFENHSKVVSLLKVTDKYSYEMYLVHQFLILGPFSLMELTPILPVNIVIILIGIMILTWLLKKVEEPIMKKIA